MFFIPASYPLRRVIKDFIVVLNFTVCFCFFTQQVPEKVGQSDAVYEVVSLQREAERSNEKRERLTSAPEEEEAEEGKILFFCCCFVTVYIQLLQMIVLLDVSNSNYLWSTSGPSFSASYKPDDKTFKIKTSTKEQMQNS